ncbi:hypothetical protein NMG60_11023337 [Bertholletia excelsa]
MATDELSKILVFGGTGYIGKHIVRACIKMGHPTYVYARPITPDSIPSKVQLREELQSTGVTIIQGELSEQEKLISIIKQVDIIISTLGAHLLMEQFRIIDAIKAAGNGIKRFVPSEFGVDDERTESVLPPFQAYLDKRKKVRTATQEAGIPFTCLSSSCFGEYFLGLLFHPHDPSPDLTIFGSGQAKVVLTREEDIATYTIKVANDPRTLNRAIYCRPPGNVTSQLDLISLWEKKTGRSYNKVHVSEEDIVNVSLTSAHPQSAQASILHSIFVKGDMAGFELREDDMEVSQLYPDFECSTVDKLIDSFLANVPVFESAAL